MHTLIHSNIHTQSCTRAWPDTDTYAMRTERTQRLVLRFLPPCPISPSQMNGNLALCALNKQTARFGACQPIQRLLQCRLSERVAGGTRDLIARQKQSERERKGWGGRSKFKCCCNYAIKNFNWNSYQWQSDQKRYVKLIRRRITAQLRRGAGWLKIWPLITAIPVMEIFARVAWVTLSRRCCCCYTQQWLNGGSLCVCTKSSAYMYMCVYVIVVDVDAGVGVRLRQFCVVWAARRSASVYQFCWWWHFSCRHCLWVYRRSSVCVCECAGGACCLCVRECCQRQRFCLLPFSFFSSLCGSC